MAIGAETNVKWVDGLRGLASITVVTTHLCRAFFINYFSPSPGEDKPPTISWYPFIRILWQGRLGVGIFAFVTGYVCALKPIKLHRQDNQEAAFTAVSKSAVRRFPRLFLPAAAATFVAWLLAELGMYSVLKHSDAEWINDQAHVRIGNLSSAIWELGYQIARTWLHGENDYDGNQWTMLPLLQESMKIYAFVVATAYVKPRYRMGASLALAAYYWCASEPVFGLLGFFGVFVAELQLEATMTAFADQFDYPCQVGSIFLVVIGLFIASYPGVNPEWVTWSRLLHYMLVPILPTDADYPRFSSAIGLIIIVFGILLNARLQKLLANKYLLFLGRMSFAVYLLHGQLIKTVLSWMLYGITIKPDHLNNGQPEITKLQYPGNFSLAMWQVIFLPLLYTIAYMWTMHVDPWCEKWSNKLVEFAKLDAGKENPGFLSMRPVQR